MGRGIAFLCLAFGAATSAAALGLLPSHYYVAVDAPREIVGFAGGVFVIIGLAALARDHSGSDILSAVLLLAFSAIMGWLTFYGPESFIEGGISFIPAAVRESVGRLLFGFGALASAGLGFLALRKLLD